MQARASPETYQSSSAPARNGSAGLPWAKIFWTAVSVAVNAVGVSWREKDGRSSLFQTSARPRVPSAAMPKRREWHERLQSLKRDRARTVQDLVPGEEIDPETHDRREAARELGQRGGA